MGQEFRDASGTYPGKLTQESPLPRIAQIAYNAIVKNNFFFKK